MGKIKCPGHGAHDRNTITGFYRCGGKSAGQREDKKR